MLLGYIRQVRGIQNDTKSRDRIWPTTMHQNPVVKIFWYCDTNTSKIQTIRWLLLSSHACLHRRLSLKRLPIYKTQ